jgi:geranylgeranyl pyrophosphate synthase
MLDFTQSAADLGKPAGADLTLGIATAPVLFAWEEYPELGPLVKRKFSEEGDVEKVGLIVLLNIFVMVDALLISLAFVDRLVLWSTKVMD